MIGMTRRSSMKLRRSSHASSSSVARGACRCATLLKSSSGSAEARVSARFPPSVLARRGPRRSGEVSTIPKPWSNGKLRSRFAGCPRGWRPAWARGVNVASPPPAAAASGDLPAASDQLTSRPPAARHRGASVSPRQPRIHHERKEIRVAGRPGRKEGQLRQALRSRVRVHRGGRPEHRHRRRRRRGDGHRHAGDAGDGAGRDPAHPRSHRQADPLRDAVALPCGARARRVRVPARAHHRQPGHVRPDRRARRAGHEERDRALSAAVPRSRIGAGSHLADARVREAPDAVAGQAARRDHAAGPRPHQGRHGGVAAAGEDPVLRRPRRVRRRRRTPAMRTLPIGRPRSTRSPRSAPRSWCRAAALR